MDLVVGFCVLNFWGGDVVLVVEWVWFGYDGCGLYFVLCSLLIVLLGSFCEELGVLGLVGFYLLCLG